MKSDNWFLALIYSDRADGKADIAFEERSRQNGIVGFVEQHSQDTTES